MIYSGSGSSYDFSEFRIRIQPLFFKANLEIKTHILNSIKTKNLPTICHFPFHTTLQSYRTHSPEFTCLKLEIKFLFICSFIFCWIPVRIGSGTIIPDQDPGKSSGSTTLVDTVLQVEHFSRSRQFLQDVVVGSAEYVVANW